MAIDQESCLNLIDSMQERLWSDYVTHYYLTCIIGLRKFQQKSDLVRSALSETTPQYSKSRVAAAWACLELGLDDQMEIIYELANSAYWQPLRWTCQQVFARLVEKQQLNVEGNKKIFQQFFSHKMMHRFHLGDLPYIYMYDL